MRSSKKDRALRELDSVYRERERAQLLEKKVPARSPLELPKDSDELPSSEWMKVARRTLRARRMVRR